MPLFEWVTLFFCAVVEATNGFVPLSCVCIYQFKVSLDTIAAFSVIITMMLWKPIHTSNANSTQTFGTVSLSTCGSDLCFFSVGTASTFSFSLPTKPASYWFLFIKLSSVKCSEQIQTLKITSRSLVPCSAITSALYRLAMDNVYALAPMGTR